MAVTGKCGQAPQHWQQGPHLQRQQCRTGPDWRPAQENQSDAAECARRRAGITLDHLAPGVIYFRLHDNGNAGPRARAENATGAQVAVVDGTTTLTAGEATRFPSVCVAHNGATGFHDHAAAGAPICALADAAGAGQPVVGALDGDGGVIGTTQAGLRLPALPLM